MNWVILGGLLLGLVVSPLSNSGLSASNSHTRIILVGHHADGDRHGGHHGEGHHGGHHGHGGMHHGGHGMHGGHGGHH